MNYQEQRDHELKLGRKCVVDFMKEHGMGTGTCLSGIYMCVVDIMLEFAADKEGMIDELKKQMDVCFEAAVNNQTK
jgi:hypothetical protein